MTNKPLYVCKQCKGKCYDLEAVRDIHGDICFEPVECTECDGTGLVEKEPKQ